MMTPEQICTLLDFKCENMRRDAERHLRAAEIKHAPDNDFRRGYAAALNHLADMLCAVVEVIREPTAEEKKT